MKRKPLDLTGKQFGRLIVIHQAATRENYQTHWLCRCKCGNEIETSTSNLNRAGVRSCGCLALEISSKVHKTHGATNSPTWNAWSRMKWRSSPDNLEKFENYAGRGIVVCARWLHSFENFLADMGEQPKGLTLERKNNDGNYEPGNCIWATQIEQANNKRTNRIVSIKGVEKTVAQWARIYRVNEFSFRRRLREGLEIENWLEQTGKSI